jgi:hypothetical protein
MFPQWPKSPEMNNGSMRLTSIIACDIKTTSQYLAYSNAETSDKREIKEKERGAMDEK